MTSITIRQLHEQTGRWVRQAAALGELHVTDRGRPVARLVPATVAVATPYFFPSQAAAGLPGHPSDRPG